MKKQFGTMLLLVVALLALCIGNAMADYCEEFGHYWEIMATSTTDGESHAEYCQNCDSIRDVACSYSTRTCTDNERCACGYIRAYAFNHSFTGQTYTSDNNATCEADGTKTAKCVRYGTGGCAATDTITDEGSKLGHSYETYMPDENATCEKDGTKTAKCVRYGMDGCAATDTIPDEGSKLGHDWKETQYDWAADGSICTATRICDRDDRHNQSVWVKAQKTSSIEPTCTEKGKLTFVATFTSEWAKKSSNTIFTEELGHELGNYESDNNATCEADGTKTAKCIRYGKGGCTAKDTVEDAGSMLGHDWEIAYEWTEDYSTCTASLVCMNDDNHSEIVAVIPTVYVEPAECTQPGVLQYIADFEQYWAEQQVKEVPLARRGHWYGEWSSTSSTKHSAACKRDGYSTTAPCELFSYSLTAESAYEFVLCPICGAVNDGTRLELVNGAVARAITKSLPDGELVCRMGELSNGETIMSICFEFNGELTQPTGEVKITLPLELLRDYTLSILSADGTETPLSFTTAGRNATFTLDFGKKDATSAVVIHLLPKL